MALALTSQAVNHTLRTKQLYLSAQASGLYKTGGDTLNLQAIPLAVGQSADDAMGYPGNIKDFSVVSAPPGFSASLVKGATLSTWGLQVFQTASAAPDGIPLGLGTLSAAATQSTFTSAGLLTVVGANTLTPGQYIVLSNGASSYGISLSGMMAEVVSATAASYTCYVGQALALAWTINTDTLKYQVVQAGSSSNLLQGQLMAAPITGVLATTALLTITQANTLQVGQFVALGNGFKAASYYCNGAIVQVTSATSTGWTAKWQGTIISQTSSETATAKLLVTNGNAPVVTYPQFGGPVATITNSLAVASGSAAAGLFTLTAIHAYQPGMIISVQGLGVNTTANGSIATVISTGLTQALIKANGWTVIENTQAETVGYASVLVTGPQQGTIGELPAAAYPAGAMAAPFVLMLEGPKGQI